MTDHPSVDSLTLTHRSVLLSVVELAASDSTPAYSYEIRHACQTNINHVSGDVVGGLSESAVMRALNELAAADYLDERIEDQSTVGKGRPAYTLTDSPGSILDGLDDDRLAPIVDRIRT